MLLEYVDAALRRAKYEIIQGEDPYYAEIRGLRGVWATGRTLEKCRQNLIEVLEGWILVRLSRGMQIPRLGGRTVQPTRARLVA